MPRWRGNFYDDPDDEEDNDDEHEDEDDEKYEPDLDYVVPEPDDDEEW